MVKRVIISGGGTGGHIFPAIAIANALRQIDSRTEILFVGALGKMEMTKVPAAGYQIIGLDIKGFQRQEMLKNLWLPFKIIKSVLQSLTIIRNFKPDVVVGVGGYASGPLLYAASLRNVPILIQEQNSYAGITNKYLGKKATKICVAFDGMSQFFKASKIIKTGNPIRQQSVDIAGKREEALAFFGLSPMKKTILLTGGSLGAATLNKSIEAGLSQLKAKHIQLIWQTGKYYFKDIEEKYGQSSNDKGIKIREFLNRMDLAYAAADVIISRAGAGTIAELCSVKKPVILIPSPNVTDDHQTKNAKALIENNCAILVADKHAEAELIDVAIKLLSDKEAMKTLGENIGKLAMPNADMQIAKEVFKLASK
jgi:UDP-N-acetylglucosamine--N-acetylmuramyl-(pentapeptide) pyrophosphoryl-undecaprenol N-acetylglucosamine transferase